MPVDEFLPPPDPKYEAAIVIFCRYQVATETYDRTLPGYWHPRAPDEWIPHRPSGASFHYAKECQRAADEELRRAEISFETAERARRVVLHMRFAEWIRILERAASPAT